VHKDFAQTICDTYSLGDFLSVEQVHGGLVHTLWKMNTTAGPYAVKELRPDMQERENAHTEFALGEKTALYFKEHRIPAVPALFLKDEVIFHYNEHSVVVYPWVNAFPHEKEIIDRNHARQVAILLGKIHTAGARLPITTPFWHILVTDSEWNEIETLVIPLADSWAKEFLTLLPTIRKWTPRFADAYKQLEKHLLVGHRDLNQKNVLWSDQDEPSIVDWESSGTTNPTLEMIGTILEWSKAGPDFVDEQIFRAFIQTYAQEYSLFPDEIEAAFLCKIAEWLQWFKFSIERATLEKFASEKHIGLKEITFSQTWLTNLFQNMITYVGWAQEEAAKVK
jgi:thiamine kinase-like enzyme